MQHQLVGHSARHLTRLGAAVVLSAFVASTAGCGGSDTSVGSASGATISVAAGRADSTGRPTDAPPASADATRNSADAARDARTAPGPTATDGDTGTTVVGAAATGAARSGASATDSPAQGSSAGAPAAATQTTSSAYEALGGPLAGLECHAAPMALKDRTLVSYAIDGATAEARELEATLSFQPVLLGRGGGMGDIATSLETFVATDGSGRLHYIEQTVRRDDSGANPVAQISTDVVIGEDFGFARAIGASVALHAVGDPEVFVVDEGGRLLRYTMSGSGRAAKLSAARVIATGLTAANAMNVQPFDLDGDLAQEKDVATRVTIADGGTLKQVIVKRDGSSAPITTVPTGGALPGGTVALAQLWCVRAGGGMAEQGGFAVVAKDGTIRAYGGQFTPAVRDPKLSPAGAVLPGLAGQPIG